MLSVLRDLIQADLDMTRRATSHLDEWTRAVLCSLPLLLLAVVAAFQGDAG